jgi:glycosyltransferase involved in cell wall biosynthesis
MPNYRVLYVSYDGLTDPLGQSQILPYILGLEKKGFEFDIISFEKKHMFEINRELVLNLIVNKNIHWHYFFYTKKPPVISTLYDVNKMKRCAKKLHKENPFGIIHGRSYLSALVGLYFKRNYRLPFIFDMRGLWADERVDGALWNLKNPFYKRIYTFFKKKELQFLRHADTVISLTDAAKEEIISKLLPSIDKNKIHVIPCATDFNKFNPELFSTKKQELLNELDIPENAFVLGYLGSIGTWYLLEEMLKFFSIFRKKNPSAIFLFLTPNPVSEIISAAQKFDVEKHIRIKYVTSDKTPQHIRLMDYGIFFIKPSYSKMSSSPTKFAELLAMNVPVICNNIGDLKKHVEQIPACFCVDDFSEATFEEICKNIHSKKQTSSTREPAKEIYDLDNAVQHYHTIYQQLTRHEQ